MLKMTFLNGFFLLILVSISFAQAEFETDTFQTSEGNLTITFIGHATLMFDFDGKIIHIDPQSHFTDYSQLPKADLIVITHEHGDHFDLNAIKAIQTENTKIVYTELCSKKMADGIVMKNGDVKTIAGIKIEAIPAYNLVHKRKEGEPFHPKGNGNGYIFTFGNKRVYVAGDTENTPEMKQLKNIDIAFLPMNLPYTMTREMVADAAKAFKPKILYPYHYGNTETEPLFDLLKDSGIDIRIRKME